MLESRFEILDSGGYKSRPMDRTHQKSWFEPNFEFNSVMESPSHYGRVVY